MFLVVENGVYDVVGVQPVLYLPPPPEHPPPSDIGSPPDSPSDPRYPSRRLLHSDCEPSSPAQRRRGHHPVPANRYTTIGERAQRKAPRNRFGGTAEQQPVGWNDAVVYNQ